MARSRRNRLRAVLIIALSVINDTVGIDCKMIFLYNGFLQEEKKDLWRKQS